MPRVALATCAELPSLADDDAPLLPALAAAGVEAEVAVWDDPAVDWSSCDLVVLRSTWDYAWRRREFLGWAAGVPLLANPMRVVVWNTDKTYLRDLADAGVPVVPTTYVPPGAVFAPSPADVVVKPTVSAGAADTSRESDGGAAAVAALQAAGRTAMVQPYLPALETAGETSVVVLGGQVSHAVRREPLLLTGGRDEVRARTPTAAELAVVQAALGAVRHELLYARVDLVPGPAGPLLLELELTEPALFIGLEPAAPARFAAAVAAALERARG